jgi:isoleucyl-tRNA synthetase
LREILVRAPSKGDEESLRRVEEQILSELNVKRMRITSEVGDLIHYIIKPNLPVLGPKYGQRLGAIRAALSAADPAAIAQAVEAEQPVVLNIDGSEGPLELEASEVLVETQEKEGFAVAQEAGLVVALDTELDEALLQEGLARDLVRTLNDMRKAAGFDVSDRVTTYYAVGADGKPEDTALVRGAISNFGDYIRAETLSTTLSEAPAPDRAYSQEEKVGSVTLSLAVLRNG